jgi:two-component system, OmpR family, response regulator
MASVLVVEDDPFVRSALIRQLTDAAHTVRSVGTALEALREVAHFRFDVVVLDLGLPDLDGSEALKMLRGITDVPVIIATARDDESEIVRLLNAGADDYLIKPFSFVVLIARLRALIRRGAPERPVVLSAGDLALDPSEHRVFRAGTQVAVTPREFALLEFLLRNRGHAVTKTAIIENVWDAHFDGDPNIVEVYIGYLRKKIDHPFGRAAIQTVRGAGYRLSADGG